MQDDQPSHEEPQISSYTAAADRECSYVHTVVNSLCTRLVCWWWCSMYYILNCVYIYMYSSQLQVCKYIYIVGTTYRAQQWPQNMRTHVARHALLPHPSFSVDLVYIHTDDVYCIILMYYIKVYICIYICSQQYLIVRQSPILPPQKNLFT